MARNALSWLTLGAALLVGCGETTGAGQCQPRCAEHACGTITDACGTIECGPCAGLETCGGSGTPNVCGRAPLRSEPPPSARPSMSGYEVIGAPNKQIRQGASSPIGEPARPVRIVIRGERFTAPTSVRCEAGTERVPVPIRLVAAEASDTRITLDVDVPHGAPLGTYTIGVSMHDSPGVWVAGAITVTPVTVCSGCASQRPAGSAPDSGTGARPYGRYADALAQAAPGDTILLSAGTYAWGEDPAVSPRIVGEDVASATANLPFGVRLRGEGPDKTILVGPPPQPAASPAQRAIGIVFGARPADAAGRKWESGHLEELTLRGFDVGVLVRDTKGSLANVVIEGARASGFWGTGAEELWTGILSEVTIRRAGEVGVRVDPGGSAWIEKSQIVSNGRWGVLSRGGRVTVRQGSIAGNGALGGGAAGGSGGMLIDGEGARTLADVSIANADIRDNIGDGVVMRGGTKPAIGRRPVLGFSYAGVFQNTVNGVTVTDEVDLSLYSSTVKVPSGANGGCAGTPVRLLGTSSAQFGGDPGFMSSLVVPPDGDCYALEDLRPPGTTWTGPVTVSETVFINTTAPQEPAVGCYDQDKDRKWRIATPGTCGTTPGGTTGNVVRVVP